MSYGLIHRHTVIGSGGGGSDQLAEFADGTISVFNDPTITRIVDLYSVICGDFFCDLNTISLPNLSQLERLLCGTSVTGGSISKRHFDLISLPKLESINNVSSYVIAWASNRTAGSNYYYSYANNTLGLSDCSVMYFDNLSTVRVSYTYSQTGGTRRYHYMNTFSPFIGISNLQSIYFMMSSAFTLISTGGGYVFGTNLGYPVNSGLSIYVPMSLLSEYRSIIDLPSSSIVGV